MDGLSSLRSSGHNCALGSGLLKTLLSRMGLSSLRPGPANRVFERSDWQPVKVRRPWLAQDPHGRAIGKLKFRMSPVESLMISVSVSTASSLVYKYTCPAAR